MWPLPSLLIFREESQEELSEFNNKIEQRFNNHLQFLERVMGTVEQNTKKIEEQKLESQKSEEDLESSLGDLIEF